MTGMAEAAGDMATGLAWGRAAEPRAGEATGHEIHGACLNCAAALVGPYCHSCGQSAHVHRTLVSIGHDLLHGVFHFEGKIWRTIPMLVLHPGALTRRYIAGERARFVSPLALFLFTVFLMFAIFSALGPDDLAKGLEDGVRTPGQQLAAVRATNAQALSELETRRARLVAAGKPTAEVDRQLLDLRHAAQALAVVGQRVAGTTPDKPISVHSNIGWLDAGLQRARDNPRLALYKVQSAAYKFSWALIFLSTPFVALLFLWRRRFSLYDHATFVTYSIGFMSLLAIVVEVLIAISAPAWLVAGLLLLAPPVHMFVQLRGAYGLSRFSAAWRTTFLLMFAWLALMLFVVGVIAMEVAH